jgi:UDP-N-acetylglucosamine--N-acetylmuramyl-(pentapeptide) pyrophosphoryl-undecaprenol N-acetylglucosamine transferase
VTIGNQQILPLGTRPPRILFTGGGTGGHVFPAIAIADAVRRQRPEAVVAFAGARDRFEWGAVPQAGYPIHAVRSQGLIRGRSKSDILKNLKLPFTVSKGLWDAWRLVGSFDADIAVGTGGFVSGPVILAAHLRKRPVLIQEQNAHVGLTNRFLARFADRIHTAFNETLSVFPPARTTVSGNPTRSGLGSTNVNEAREFFGVEPGRRVLLVLGGSGGSRVINDTFAKQLLDFLEDDSVVLIWQAGARYYDELRERLDDHPRLRLLKFIDRMDYAYAVATLAICRSGASTCAELLITGTPSILIPSPNVAEDHQTRNAEGMVNLGAARIITESRIGTELFEMWKQLWNDTESLQSLSLQAKQHATPDAADTIAKDVLQLAGRRNS